MNNWEYLGVGVLIGAALVAGWWWWLRHKATALKAVQEIKDLGKKV